jgi:hypothetical protein
VKIRLYDSRGVEQRTITVGWRLIRKWPWIIGRAKQRSVHGRASVLGFTVDDW